MNNMNKAYNRVKVIVCNNISKILENYNIDGDQDDKIKQYNLVINYKNEIEKILLEYANAKVS